MGDRVLLVRNNIADLMLYYQLPVMSVDLPKYVCFKRTLSCLTRYQAFWKPLKSKLKGSNELVFYTAPLGVASAISLSPALQRI